MAEVNADLSGVRAQPVDNVALNDGYVLALVGKVRIGVHRLVMSAELGRPLAPGENVHHVNGNRSDNRLENLELWVTSQPAGQRPADLVAYARELLALYESPVRPFGFTIEDFWESPEQAERVRAAAARGDESARAALAELADIAAELR